MTLEGDYVDDIIDRWEFELDDLIDIDNLQSRVTDILQGTENPGLASVLRDRGRSIAGQFAQEGIGRVEGDFQFGPSTRFTVPGLRGLFGTKRAREEAERLEEERD